MKKSYVTPAISRYSVSMTYSMLTSSLPHGKGRKTDEAYSRHDDRWREEEDNKSWGW